MTGAAFVAMVRRDLALASAQGGGAMLALGFFVLAVVLFPLAVGPEPQTLARIAPGVLWVAALLACLLSLDRLFQADYEDGSLEQLVLGPLPLSQMVIAKCLAHWLTTGLPLALMAPLLGIFLQLPGEAYLMLMVSFLLGTPALSFIGAIAAGLTVAIRRGGALVAILVLPLYIPSLIFGVGAVEAVIFAANPRPSLMLMAAISIASIILAPMAAAAALRLALE